MKLLAPDYYPEFRCIAEACRHSCCIGWEIDIDEETRELYRGVPGALGARLACAIEDGEEGASFRLDNEERCPFLNADGLCDLILSLGEGALSQICTDHPRYRSYFGDHTEIGVGLCCEAAAALILHREPPVRTICLAEDDSTSTLSESEAALLAARDSAIATAQNRSLSMEERLCRLAELPRRDFAEWCAIYASLDQMDPAWRAMLTRASHAHAVAEMRCSEIMQEQLLVYFLTRHLPTALDYGTVEDWIRFSVLSVRMIAALAARLPEISPEEIARMYSAEIEYSEENPGVLLSYV